MTTSVSWKIISCATDINRLPASWNVPYYEVSIISEPDVPIGPDGFRFIGSTFSACLFLPDFCPVSVLTPSPVSRRSSDNVPRPSLPSLCLICHLRSFSVKAKFRAHLSNNRTRSYVLSLGTLFPCLHMTTILKIIQLYFWLQGAQCLQLISIYAYLMPTPDLITSWIATIIRSERLRNPHEPTPRIASLTDYNLNAVWSEAI
jgi:hypothetical protein